MTSSQSGMNFICIRMKAIHCRFSSNLIYDTILKIQCASHYQNMTKFNWENSSLFTVCFLKPNSNIPYMFFQNCIPIINEYLIERQTTSETFYLVELKIYAQNIGIAFNSCRRIINSYIAITNKNILVQNTSNVCFSDNIFSPFFLRKSFVIH